ncbi:hypothetical protein RHGRI_002094 [Rhododendron griersonianum]|uniref:Large ribosomal RNA subunit accumulation protein YCED homolog 1, chloroplastic n=1 Tax=Rhododendron griersonianum TaxID=479676 RepID=A0AAV6LNL6_9ERIC|nr:hypothetical protein RHGRI_002094 [Rhododendron griersonianum]
MSLILPSSPTILSFHTRCLKSSSPSNLNFACAHRSTRQGLSSFCNSTQIILKNKPPNTLRFVARECMNSDDVFIDDWWDPTQYDEDMGGSPWEGAVVYQRNASVSHVEYCTTLERLGLAKISTEVSRSRASVMGLRVTKAVKDFPLGTPVLISVDVTRKRQKLRLDGIVRTVISLLCNRCAEPTAETIFRDFSLLLTEEPVEEPETIDMGVIFDEDMFRTSRSGEVEEYCDDASIDWEDRLHFPPGEKSIDISKHIRDILHLEIVIDAICDPKCKGLCLKCGCNLNTSACSCSQQKTRVKGSRPLRGLREKMQQNEF